jgi:hypothetical protein
MERLFKGDLVMETTVEQRKNTRTILSWPVSIWLPQANRFFNGQSANISKTGVFVSVPITTPVRPGKVVRVERRNLLRNGNIGVAIRFQ